MKSQIITANSSNNLRQTFPQVYRHWLQICIIFFPLSQNYLLSKTRSFCYDIPVWHCSRFAFFKGQQVSVYCCKQSCSLTGTLCHSLTSIALTSRRENHGETFCNSAQAVCFCHCLLSWFCNLWRCQIKRRTLLFRSLCALHSVRHSAGLSRSSLVVHCHVYCFESFVCDSSW